MVTCLKCVCLFVCFFFIVVAQVTCQYTHIPGKKREREGKDRKYTMSGIRPQQQRHPTNTHNNKDQIWIPRIAAGMTVASVIGLLFLSRYALPKGGGGGGSEGETGSLDGGLLMNGSTATTTAKKRRRLFVGQGGYSTSTIQSAKRLVDKTIQFASLAQQDQHDVIACTHANYAMAYLNAAMALVPDDEDLRRITKYDIGALRTRVVLIQERTTSRLLDNYHTPPVIPVVQSHLSPLPPPPPPPPSYNYYANSNINHDNINPSPAPVPFSSR